MLETTKRLVSAAEDFVNRGGTRFAVSFPSFWIVVWNQGRRCNLAFPELQGVNPVGQVRPTLVAVTVEKQFVEILHLASVLF